MDRDKKQAYLKRKMQYINEYNKQNTRSVLLKLNVKTDGDVIQKLDSVPSKMGYIKNLIREDIENEL